MIARVLRAVADEIEGTTAASEQGEEVDSLYLGPGGTDKLLTLAEAVTQNARWLLRQIAADNLSDGESLGRTIRERAGGVNEGTLGGWVWSLSSAEKRIGLPRPYDTGYEERANGKQVVYRMRPAVAETITDLLDEDGNLLAA
ncbi:MAG TPA: hypothetical protein VN892_17435 [Solirubrobacteraceae bacterium]|nr:hypothetical protein [Solirubrobacteraceae bacterium]